MRLVRPLIILAVLAGALLVPSTPAFAGACKPPTITPDFDNVTYKTLGDGTDVTLDIFLPSGPGPFPGLVMVHGSLWKTGCKENIEVEADTARDNGFAVFNIDTRLDCISPPPGIDPGLCGYNAIDPAIDVGDAVAWVRAHAGQYKADAGHVGAMGTSTGGNLAFMAAVTGTPGGTRADAVVGWSGATELGYLVDGTVACDQSSKPPGCTSSRTKYVGCSLSACPSAWAAASPYTYLDATAAPLFIANSLAETVPYQEAVDTYNQALKLGIPATLCSVPGSSHGKHYENKFCQENGTQTVFQWTLATLHSYLG